MKDLWINKYNPKNIDDIIGNKNSIKQLTAWLLQLGNNNVSNSIILSGIHGIGKTQAIKLLLKKFNYKVKVIYPDDIKTYRIDNDFIDFYNYNNSINSKINFKKKEQNKLAIIFDDIESISLQSEKKFVYDIFKINNKNKLLPIIFISNNNHSKLINDLKKYCNEIVFTSPSLKEIKTYIVKICKKEKIKIEEEIGVEKLIDFCQKDIRRLINLLQDFSYNYKKINRNNIENFICNSKKKNIDINLYNATLELINDKNSLDNIYRLYETEKVLLPLMVHENYYKKILNSNSESFEDNLEQVINISDSLSFGDNIETSIYTDQNWYLQNIHGYYTCVNTAHWLNKSEKNINFNDIKFSSDLNKTSLKNINKKNIQNFKKIILKKELQEILLINQFCNKLYLDNKVNKIIEILKEYKKNVNIKEFELCMKIDKTNDFNVLSTKDKKKITKEYNLN